MLIKKNFYFVKSISKFHFFKKQEVSNFLFQILNLKRYLSKSSCGTSLRSFFRRHTPLFRRYAESRALRYAESRALRYAESRALRYAESRALQPAGLQCRALRYAESGLCSLLCRAESRANLCAHGLHKRQKLGVTLL